MGLGVAEGSEVPGDCLPDCGHADIALGAGVGERDVRVTGEARHLGVALGQRLVEVFSVGLEGCLVEGRGVEFTDRSAGSAQEPGHAPGPDLTLDVLDEPEVAQQVGTAQRVATVIVGNRAGPSVSNQDAAVAGG